MSVQTSGTEPFAVLPDAQARTSAPSRHPWLHTPAAASQATANCSVCGKAWFGEVAYCPYCGRPSASAGLAAAAHAPAGWFHGTTHAIAGGVRSYTGKLRSSAVKMWKPIALVAALATALAALVVGVGELAVADLDRPAPRAAVPVSGGDAARTGPPEAAAGVAAAVPAPRGDAARTGTPEPSAAVAAPAPPVPRADVMPPPQQPAPAPLARNRALCSAANEAAGLCKPQ